MSPLWRNRLWIFIGPERISLRRLGRGLGPKILGSHDEAVSASGKSAEWEAALVRLDSLLGQPEWQAPEAEVVLSNRFVRYAVVPIDGQLKKYPEQEAYAKHVLNQMHGSVIGQWELRLQKGRDGKPALASAVDNALLGEIRRVARAHGIKLRSVSPDLRSVLDGFGEAFRHEPAWLVVREPGYSLFALYDKGAFVAVNGVSHAGLAELPALLDRENLISGLPEPCKNVYVYSHARETLGGISQAGYEMNLLELPSGGDFAPARGGARDVLRLDYQRAINQPRRAAGWMLLAAGVALLLEVAVSYGRLHHERAVMIRELQASGFGVDLPSSTASGGKFTEKELAAAHDIMSRLSAPWENFFSSIESIKNNDVAILTMDPDIQAGALTIGGEAKDYAAVLTLIAQLRRKSEFADVFLQRHEIKADDPQHPVSFSISMRWVMP